ncbi:MAG: hypothetical protein Wins2KO_30120 [Winogradskyella sp.]
MTFSKLVKSVFTYILFTLLTFAQSNKELQQQFNVKLIQIDSLAKSGNITSAIIEAEDAKVFAFKNFKESYDNQRMILFKLNFYYRVTRDKDNELRTNVELGKLRKKELEWESDSFKTSLDTMLEFYNSTPNPREVIPTFREVNTRLINHTKDVLASRLTDEKESFLNENIIPYFHVFQSFGYKNKYKYGGFNNLLVDNTLLVKGALLNTSKDILSKLRTVNNPAITNMINAYINEKEFTAQQLSISESQRVPDFQVRYDRLGGLESEILYLYQQNFKDERKRTINWRRTALREDEIAVEFSHFRYFDKTWTDSIIYVAQLFKKDWRNPKIIPLFEENQLKDIMSKGSNISNNLSRGSKAKQVNASSYDRDLYNLIIKPIETELKGNDKVYISADGMLHQVAFSALMNASNKRLVELYNLEQVSSSRVITLRRKQPKKSSVLLVGGVNYDFNTEGKDILYNSQTSFLDIVSEEESNTLKTSWNYLQGTADEINNIENILTSKTTKVSTLANNDASETKIKALNGKSPDVIHIATHGFFFKNNKSKDTNSIEFKNADNPLLRSGLLLAHANYAWQNGNNPYERNDGILTALEISNLDLSKTDLVVLSDCETGLGDIEGSEGVYGLQRAFKMAGVKNIMMSLWEVPDKETAEFMTSFYELWLKNNTIRQAFNKTQRKMHKLYPNNPEKWAAFVLIE